MKLTDDERAMLDGKQGPARQKAMDLLVRYGEALGAEDFVDTNNVCTSVGATTPFLRDFAAKAGGLDAAFSEFNLDSSEAVQIPKAKAFSCQLIQGLDPDHWQEQGVAPATRALHEVNESFSAGIGLQMMNTCTPYLVGNVPVKGEHCAWMESSAVAYCNSVLGGRTNTEGRESSSAAMLTGKIPNWGLHLDENRFGTHLVEVDAAVEDIMDWGLLGYYLGEAILDGLPVLVRRGKVPDLPRLKHFGAAAATSGGIEMYHIVGVTPQAPTLQEAFGGRKPRATLRYGRAERELAYRNLNAHATDTKVDFVMLGCPHSSLEQVWNAAKLLEGKRLHSGVNLWIFTPRSIREVADRNGYTKIITDAGARLMSDTCPALGQVMPKGVKVAATDSAKQTHYLPSIMGVQTWFGSTEDCVRAAITGRWEGALR
jgi:predicted aconitase